MEQLVRAHWAKCAFFRVSELASLCACLHALACFDVSRWHRLRAPRSRIPDCSLDCAMGHCTRATAPLGEVHLLHCKMLLTTLSAHTVCCAVAAKC